MITFKQLQAFIEKEGIDPDVHLLSDSGWECGSTDMDGLYYNKKQNVIVFTQGGSMGLSYALNYKPSDGWVYYENFKRKRQNLDISKRNRKKI